MPARNDERHGAWLSWPTHVLLRSRVLLWLTAAGAAVLIVSAAFAHSWLLVVDRPLSEALRRDTVPTVLRWITEAGAPTSVAILSLVAAAALWQQCRVFAMALPTTVAAGILADVGLKVLVGRPRPMDPLIGTSLGSFPSGHVIQATIVFGLLVPALYLLTGRVAVRRAAEALFAVMTGGVAVSRIALGAHWPTDVLASFLIGGGLLLAAEHVVGSRWARDLCGACRLHPTP